MNEKFTPGELKAISLVSALAAKLIQKGIITREEWDQICESAEITRAIHMHDEMQEELK